MKILILAFLLAAGQVTAPFSNGALAASGVIHGVDLSWTASVTSGTTTSVYRATVHLGPYTRIASGVSATTYHDAGLPSATTYYYVVTAVGSGGESANSTEASATTL